MVTTSVNAVLLIYLQIISLQSARILRYEVLVRMRQGIFGVFRDVMLFSLVKTVFLRGSAYLPHLTLLPRRRRQSSTVFLNFYDTAGHNIAHHTLLDCGTTHILPRAVLHLQFSMQSVHFFVRIIDPLEFKHYLSQCYFVKIKPYCKRFSRCFLLYLLSMFYFLLLVRNRRSSIPNNTLVNTRGHC